MPKILVNFNIVFGIFGSFFISLFLRLQVDNTHLRLTQRIKVIRIHFILIRKKVKPLKAIPPGSGRFLSTRSFFVRPCQLRNRLPGNFHSPG